jgi:hypothetical protein
MRIHKYITAAGDTLKELDENVNAMIDEGFEPYGNPYFVGHTDSNVDSPICQAMIMTVETSRKIEIAKAEVKARQKRG